MANAIEGDVVGHLGRGPGRVGDHLDLVALVLGVEGGVDHADLGEHAGEDQLAAPELRYGLGEGGIVEGVDDPRALDPSVKRGRQELAQLGEQRTMGGAREGGMPGSGTARERTNWGMVAA